MAVKPPKRAPDFTLGDTRGQRFSLSVALVAGQPVMLIFLRHLG